MSETTIDIVNTKLKSLPEILLKDVERYIDYLSYKFIHEEVDEIHQWQKDVVMERGENPQIPVYAFKILEELEN